MPNPRRAGNVNCNRNNSSEYFEQKKGNSCEFGADFLHCLDGTELIRVEIDSSDHLIAYRLRKRGCGATIGDQSLLVENLRGNDISQILRLDVDSFRGKNENRFYEFLRFKHLSALKAAIKAFIGKDSEGLEDNCRVVEIIYDDNWLAFEAEFDVNFIAEKTRPYDSCQSGCAFNKALDGNRLSPLL